MGKTSSINTWRKHSRTIKSVICHVQGWMFVAYSLYKWKKYYILNVWVPVLDTFFYTVLMFFCGTVAYLLMLKQSKNVEGWKLQSCTIHLFFAYIQSAIFSILRRPNKTE